jgi:nitroreductase|tara:strand:+ start:11607 stop:12398 length:792 start_codon:yes stop_codon:yes gene_type:complete
MNEQIKDAVDVSQKAQRNWDLDKTIPEKDLDALIYAAQHSPKKQMETHYALHVFTDKEKIRAIYDQTKKFSLFPVDNPEFQDSMYADGKADYGDMFKDKDGEFWQDDDYSIKNSQILANAMFVYTEDRRTVRGGTHFLAQEGASANVMNIYEEQIDFSIGISVGQLILSAAMMGYKTGICSALDSPGIGELLPKNKQVPDGVHNAKLIIGVGYEQDGVDRRLHQETLNKDIPFDDRRTGEADGLYLFPTFEGVTDVYLNGELR